MNEYGHRVLLVMMACVLLGGVLTAQVPAPDTEQEENEEAVAGVTGRGGTVTANLLNIRARPATHYEVVAQFKAGDRVQVMGENEEWYRVLVPAEARAYVAVRYVAPDGVITGDRVRIHSGPGLQFNPYGYLNKGDRVKALGAAESDWQKIEPPAGTAAWVNKRYVKLDPLPAPPVAETPVAETVNATGKEPEAVAPGEEDEPKEPEVAKAESAGVAVGGETAVEANPAKVETVTQPAALEGEKKPETVAVVAPADVKPEALATAAAQPAGAAAEAVPQGVNPVPTSAVQGRPFGNSGQMMREGVIIALPLGSQQVVTHFLGMRILSTCYPICYLRSSRVNLAEWESREVRVYGQDVQYPNWSKPAMDVRSIHLFAAPSGGAGTALP